MARHKKKKKQRKQKQRKHCVPSYSTSRNLHHLIYQGRHWDYGYARMLRATFIFSVQVYQHNLLHNEFLHDVPCPPENVLKQAWRSYQEQKDSVDQMNLLQSIGWLMATIDDEAFRRAMAKQYCFFTNHGGWQ